MDFENLDHYSKFVCPVLSEILPLYPYAFSAHTKEIHIFGPNASELIAEAVVTMEFDGSAEDVARTIHAHPTLSEAMHEAALGVDGRTIHM